MKTLIDEQKIRGQVNKSIKLLEEVIILLAQLIEEQPAGGNSKNNKKKIRSKLQKTIDKYLK